MTKTGAADLPTGEATTSVPSASRRLLVSTAAGVTAAAVAVLAGGGVEAPMFGWDVAALVYVVWIWASIAGLDEESTARLATREDPGRRGAEILLLVASVASLASVGVVIARVGQASGLAEAALLGCGVTSVVLSWAVVHTVYTLRYARIYYGGDDGGIDFNQDSPPRFSDFAYVAFTVGMTFQVSDTTMTSREMRSTVLKHALVSYLFGAVILGTTINLLAGLSK